MLIRGEVNPLNVLDTRKLSHTPLHFEKVYIEKDKNIKNIDLWIYKNLLGRYSCKKCYNIKNNEIVDLIEIGFENPGELTIFLLSCPFL